MAVLRLLNEEEIREDNLQGYFEDLYRVVCVSERPQTADQPAALVRTTYLVDFEQLVHVLEDYGGFGEDIVEVEPVSGDEASFLRLVVHGQQPVARA